MKAVLLNSADKLTGVHGSRRDVIDSAGNDWTQSEAFSTQFQSLDDQLGAGHLNAAQAVAQYAAGEHGPGAVPITGWDLGVTGGPGDFIDYVFDEPLTGDKYIAATLVWDRSVDKTGDDDSWASGDQFLDYNNIEDVLSDLNLYLMPADSNDVADAVWSSQTFEDNVEHIFFSDFETGEYKLRVADRFSGVFGGGSEYALAWWFGDIEIEPPPTGIFGDFDGDSSVDNDDYARFVSTFGSVEDGSTLSGNGNGDGIVDVADYSLYRDNVGTSLLPAVSAASVPEPTSSGLATVVLAGVATRSRKRICSG